MIKILCVGKIKESYIKEAIQEYEKRLSKYSKIEIIEVPDISGNPITTILEKEKNELIKHIENKDYIITLEVEGKQITSTEFSEKIDSLLISHPNITFIIGGSHGLHSDIKKRSHYDLSFSKLTFPHQLFRVLLLEQIYRAYKIKNNETYHK